MYMSSFDHVDSEPYFFTPCVLMNMKMICHKICSGDSIPYGIISVLKIVTLYDKFIRNTDTN